MSTPHPSRRDFARHALLGAGALVAAPSLLAACRTAGLPRRPTATGWDLVPEILARVVPPSTSRTLASTFAARSAAPLASAM